MKGATHIPKHSRSQKALTRRADEPLLIALTNYCLSLSALLELTGRKKKRDQWWYTGTTGFQSFTGGTLVLTSTMDNQAHTLTLLIEADSLTVTCSCATPVVTICEHLYRFLFKAARLGEDGGFYEFRPGGMIETALAHPQQFLIQYTGRLGIEVQLKKGLGRVYALPESQLKETPLAPYVQLAGSDNLPAQENQVTCYLLMLSPKENQAPFILACPGTLTMDGKKVKQFGNYLPVPGMDNYPDAAGTERLRLQACGEILSASEGLAGLAGAGDRETAGKLAALFCLYRNYLSRFMNGHIYMLHYYGNKYLGKKPNKKWVFPVRLKTGEVRLQFSLHYAKGVYQLRLSFLINGATVPGYGPLASFFLSDGDWTEVYLFSSLRDAAVAYWMERNQWLVTVFEEHFAAFEREVLPDIEKHYVVKRTGRKSQ